MASGSHNWLSRGGVLDVASFIVFSSHIHRLSLFFLLVHELFLKLHAARSLTESRACLRVSRSQLMLIDDFIWVLVELNSWLLSLSVVLWSIGVLIYSTNVTIVVKFIQSVMILRRRWKLS